MKPIKLTISAFGSYADVQTVDFGALGQKGLYLITGETGAGKTTIFDAISFALFGRASGEGRGDYQTLRSDFASEGAKTYAELEFHSGGGMYTVRRVIKKTGQDAVITLPDGGAVSGVRNVEQKIAEIIGLDRNQFAQIVMIAQNDFLRFLKSDTDDKLKMLRHIFGTGALNRFQERLKALTKEHGDRRALILHDFARYGVDPYRRDEQFSAWKSQIKSDVAELMEADKRLAAYDKQKQSLAAELAVADGLVSRLDELASLLLEHEVHAKKAAEIEAARIRARYGEISLRRIKPLADEARRTSAEYASAQIALEDAEKREAAASAELEAAKKAVNELPPLADAQERSAAVSKQWETAAERLKRLEALKKSRDEILAKRAALASTRQTLDEAQEEINSLPPIFEARTRLEGIASCLNREEDRLWRLKSLREDFAVIAGKQAELAKIQAEFEALNADFSRIDREYRVLEEAFLRGQAGIIASGLKEGEPCPVCGSLSHPSPAELSGESVTEERLRQTRDARDRARTRRETKSARCGALAAETEALLGRFESDLSGLAADKSPVTAPQRLPEMINAVQAAVSGLLSEKADAEKGLGELMTKTENAIKKRDELTRAAVSLKSETVTLESRFESDFYEISPSHIQGDLGAELDDMLCRARLEATVSTQRRDAEKKSLTALADKWDSAARRKSDAELAAQAALTLLTERASNERELRGPRMRAKSAYDEALRGCGFADESEYKAALVTENELAGLNKSIIDYEKNGERLERDIARLKDETAGKPRPDIEGLRLKAEAVSRESDKLSKNRDEINSRLSKTKTALTELREAADALEKAEKSYADVKELSETANGRLDFETYAQISYFERVLRSANLRLAVMSRNRYSLLRRVGKDGRKRSGLELGVFDAYTGKERGAGSLSGGESFMASLSLALGLSDIVQQSAGGIHLDAMFIDEGFGALDSEVLETAVRALSEIAGENRLIGIISHVSELSERIDRQIRIEKNPSGSRIVMSV